MEEINVTDVISLWSFQMKGKQKCESIIKLLSLRQRQNKLY